MDDEPIFYTRHKFSHGNVDPDKLSLYRKLYAAVSNDEKDLFLRLINGPGFEQVRNYFTLDKMFRHDALNIVAAIFDGETCLIDKDDIFEGGWTPLHHAALRTAPKLTKYFLDLGFKADAVSVHNKWNLEDATPLNLSIRLIHIRRSENLHDLLWLVCHHNRDIMEVIRMLVQSEKDKTWAMEAFLDYAHKGELHKLAALFLAVPEIFLSPSQRKLSLLSKLDLELNS